VVALVDHEVGDRLREALARALEEILLHPRRILRRPRHDQDFLGGELAQGVLDREDWIGVADARRSRQLRPGLGRFLAIAIPVTAPP